MGVLLSIAELLGTDPITLIVLGVLSAACAHFLGRIANSPWSAALFFPALMAGGLVADDGAVALGLYQGFDVGYDAAGWEAAGCDAALALARPACPRPLAARMS